jgi:hypothetical protein
MRLLFFRNLSRSFSFCRCFFFARRSSALWLAGWLMLSACEWSWAQIPDVTAPRATETVASGTTESTLPHQFGGRVWVSEQVNFIFQTHPAFKAKYSGPNSLRPEYEKASSRVLTLYTGLRISRSSEVLGDVEQAAGRGLSDALGLAGFSNLDAVRNPSLGEDPYLARLLWHQVVALSKDRVEADPGPLSTFSELPARRLEVRAGKLGTVDFFDVNSVGSDSHLQFMNWAIDQNGAYDFAADTADIPGERSSNTSSGNGASVLARR